MPDRLKSIGTVTKIAQRWNMFGPAPIRDGWCVAVARLKGGGSVDLLRQGQRVDWSRPAAEVHNHIRGLAPWPGAWFEAELGGKTERVKVLRSTLGEGEGAPGAVIGDDLTIACGAGAVRLVDVQRAGKQAATAADFLRGLRAPLAAVS